MSSLDLNDEVIIPAPYWVSYPDIVSLCGGKPIIVDTQIENDFKITPNELEKKITKNTKWFKWYKYNFIFTKGMTISTSFFLSHFSA